MGLSYNVDELKASPVPRRSVDLLLEVRLVMAGVGSHIVVMVT
jgi:hypothetical protein